MPDRQIRGWKIRNSVAPDMNPDTYVGPDEVTVFLDGGRHMTVTRNDAGDVAIELHDPVAGLACDVVIVLGEPTPEARDPRDPKGT